MLAFLICLLTHSATGKASQVAPPDGKGVIDPKQHGATTECSSTSLWQNLPGRKVSVVIGDRILNVPASLPNFHADRDGDRNSAWFEFHIDGANHWSFGGYNSSQPFAWEYLLSIEVTNAPDRKSDRELLSTFLSGYTKNAALSSKNRVFDVYPGVIDDRFVGKTDYSLQIYCNDRLPGGGKQVPACVGYTAPWPNALLTYRFGRQFLVEAPSILSCIDALLRDLSMSRP
jgi:hypothetical protein